jgi:hypothetical protein
MQAQFRYGRTAQIQSDISPGRKSFLRWCLISVDPQNGTFFTDICLYYPSEHNTLNRVKNVESIVLAVIIKEMPIKKHKGMTIPKFSSRHRILD